MTSSDGNHGLPKPIQAACAFCLSPLRSSQNRLPGRWRVRNGDTVRIRLFDGGKADIPAGGLATAREPSKARPFAIPWECAHSTYNAK